MENELTPELLKKAETAGSAECSRCKYKTNKGVCMLCNHSDNYKR